jgi:hypothetical protein
MTGTELPAAGADDPGKTATPLSNRDRLRSHLPPDGLASALLEAWKKDDPKAQARMIAALHDFHKAK